MLAVILVVLLTAAGISRLRLDTGIDSFVPAGDASLTNLREAARSFGGDPVVVLVESPRPRQLLSEEQLPRLLRLEGELAGMKDVAVVYGPATLLNQLAIQAQNLLVSISGRRDGIRAAAEREAIKEGQPPAVVRRAADAAVADFDLRYGRLLVQGMPAGLPTLRNPGFINAVVFDKAGQPKSRWHFVVPRADAIAILVRPREGLDQEGVDRLVRNVRSAAGRAGLASKRVTVTGVPTVTAAVADQVRREVPLLGAVALIAVAACFLFLPWLPRRAGRLTPFLATISSMGLVLALFGWLDMPLSLGVVAFLPILLGTGSDFPMYLALPETRRRATVASLASAASFASLAISPLPFVRDLGLALALGILLTVANAMVVLRFTAPAAHRDPLPVAPESRPAMSRGRRAAALLALVGLSGIGWFGLGQMDVEARPDRLAAGLAAIDDARHAERVLGSSGEIGVELRGPDVLSKKGLEWARATEEDIVVSHGDQVRPVMTPTRLLSFLGDSPTEEQISAGLRMLPAYLTQSVIRDDRKESMMFFGLRLQSLDVQGRLLRDLQAAVSKPPDGMHVKVVGLPVVASRAYESVSASRYPGNLLALAMVFVILAGLLNRADAVRAVLAAVLAAGWGLGAAWILGVPLTPLTAALGSLTAATGCEFAVLLAAASELGLRQLNRAVAVAGVTSAVGYLVLGLSDLAVMRQFGLLLAVSIALAFAAAHVVVRLVPPRRVGC